MAKPYSEERVVQARFQCRRIRTVRRTMGVACGAPGFVATLALANPGASLASAVAVRDAPHQDVVVGLHAATAKHVHGAGERRRLRVMLRDRQPPVDRRARTQAAQHFVVGFVHRVRGMVEGGSSMFRLRSWFCTRPSTGTARPRTRAKVGHARFEASAVAPTSGAASSTRGSKARPKPPCAPCPGAPWPSSDPAC